MNLSALILAAGKGTRMKSDLPKVAHRLAGRAMIEYPVEAARKAGAESLVLVLGHRWEVVRDIFSSATDVAVALQEEQLGTGHAVQCATGALGEGEGDVLILCGDVPLVRPETLRAVVEEHRRQEAAVTVVTFLPENPRGYGRVVKDAAGCVLRIVEERDADEEVRKIREANSGIYCVDAAFLRNAVTRLSNDNDQKEYYLTDIVGIAAADGLICRGVAVGDPDEVMGINDRVQLAAAEGVLRRRINEELMLSGVTIIDPATAYIGTGIAIGRDTVIHPNVSISGETVIGEGCVIEPSAVIRDCRIGNGVTVKAGTVMTEAVLHDGVAVGPMAHLRPGSVLMEEVKVGNFVETKKALLGRGSKASHLTYLGDAEIGSEVNIGCGTITCNYDGVRKHKTVIEDGVFVGSDVQLVAPVRVGRNSLVAAGTTVTKDVPADSLAISRVAQVNKEGWRLKKREE